MNIQIININTDIKKTKIAEKFNLDFSAICYYDIAVRFGNCIDLINLDSIKTQSNLYVAQGNNSFIFFTNNLQKLQLDLSLSGELKTIQPELTKAITNYINYYSIVEDKIKEWLLPNEQKFLNMGILNLTPDSFSDGGKYFSKDLGLNHAIELLSDGADIIDLGGESSRPGAEPVEYSEEADRILPILKAIKKYAPNTIISIDTTKAKIAKDSLELGASIINDISGFEADDKMFDVLNKFKPIVVLMHTKGTPKTMQNNPNYSDVISEIYDYFVDKIKKLNNIGVDKIILDPGIGFGKRVEDNFEIINRLQDFYSLGYPILIGLSRKSFIGKTTNSEVIDRDIETAIMETLSVNNGAKLIRTHNVRNADKIKKLLTSYENY